MLTWYGTSARVEHTSPVGNPDALIANGGELEDMHDIASKAVSATVTPGRELDREISPMECDVAAISADRSREQVRADSLLMCRFLGRLDRCRWLGTAVAGVREAPRHEIAGGGFGAGGCYGDLTAATLVMEVDCLGLAGRRLCL